MPSGLNVPLFPFCSQVVLDFSLILYVVDTHGCSIIPILSCCTCPIFCFSQRLSSGFFFSVYSKYTQQQQLRRHRLRMLNVPTHLQSFITAVGLLIQLRRARQFGHVLKLDANCCWWKCFMPIIWEKKKKKMILLVLFNMQADIWFCDVLCEIYNLI